MNKLTTLLIAAACVAAPAVASAQAPKLPAGGPGIAIAGSVDQSKIPAAVTTTLSKLYPGVAIVKSEIEFAPQVYELDLANGVDIDIAQNGKVVEIDAPEGTVIAAGVLQQVLPAKTVKHLTDKGYIGMVDEIKSRGKRGYEVSLVSDQPDEIIYDINGNVLAIEF